MPPHWYWEYCELITLQVSEETGSVRKSAFLRVKGNSINKAMGTPVQALRKMRQQGWEIISITSNVQLDGTVQMTYYFRRYTGDPQ